MNGEDYTDCPQCSEKIPFYETDDKEPKQCPECGTAKSTLFDIAMADETSGEAQVAVPDGGDEQ